MSNIVIINRGTRTYTLQPITKTEKVKQKDGTEITKEVLVKERLLLPGGSIETLSEDEAKHYLSYRDIQDAAKVVPANAEKIKSMQAEIDRLTAANAKLAAAPVVAAAVESTEAPAEEKPSGRKKGK